MATSQPDRVDRLVLMVACNFKKPPSAGQFWPQLLGDQMGRLTETQRHRFLVNTERSQKRLVSDGLAGWVMRRAARGKQVKTLVARPRGLLLNEFHTLQDVFTHCDERDRQKILRSFAEFVHSITLLIDASGISEEDARNDLETVA